MTESLLTEQFWYGFGYGVVVLIGAGAVLIGLFILADHAWHGGEDA